jgi:molybdopterin/thiamine biosynthesis adenylyltransferase
MLTDHERERYARQILLADWGIETQEALKGKKAFVAGCGGSGSVTLTQLALLGVGQITMCDNDVVELSNLNRQFIHCVSEDSRIGMEKAESAKITMRNINPNVETKIHNVTITDENVDDLVGDADIIFDSVDKFVTKFVLSRCAVRKGIPHLFYGMIDINSFGCIFSPPKGPCFHCLFDNNKVKEFGKLQELSKLSVKKPQGTPVCCPPVISSCGFMMTEALKLLLGIGEPAHGKFFFFLQKGTAELTRTRGFKGVEYWFTDFFRDTAKAQGVDLAGESWRGKFVEELEVSQRPECGNCSRRTGSSST